MSSPLIAPEPSKEPESSEEPEPSEEPALIAAVAEIEQLTQIDEIEEILAMPELDANTLQSLAELDSLIGELKAKVSTLREGEYDASALESRLRELTELASRAASTLESVSR